MKSDVYLKKLILSKENGFPKVITGIRRSGKSYLLSNIFSEYLKESGVKEENIIYISLDELQNIKYRNPIELDSYIRKKCQNDLMHYVMIDEIQLVDTIINPLYTDGKYVIAKKNENMPTISFV